MLSPAEQVFRVALSHFVEIGARRFQHLQAHFGSAAAIWQASERDLANTPQFSAKLAQKLVSFRQKNPAEQIYEATLKQGLQLRFLEDPEYPALLKNIYDPPHTLYWRGQAATWKQLQSAVAVIGTRHPSQYGARVTRELSQFLAQHQIPVISGMALGIDAIAHQSCLQAGGLTLAVLGSGLLRPGPPSNRRLFDQIAEQGLVISEFPPEYPAQPWTFPVRNRIVSGLAQVVIVVEAGLKSGTLITVDCANEQGRDVFAVPGSIFSSQSAGTHALIQQGAQLLSEPAQLLDLVQGHPPSESPAASPALPPIDLTNAEKQVYLVLSDDPIHVDQISVQSEQNARDVLGILTLLELKGLAEPLPGKLYKRKP